MVLCHNDIPSYLRSNMYAVGHVISHAFTFKSHNHCKVKFLGERDYGQRAQICFMTMKQSHSKGYPF